MHFMTTALFEVLLRRSWKTSTHDCHKGSWGIGNQLWWQTREQFLTFCRPSRTVCRFLFRISSLDSYFILRSGTTAIRLKRMSWYGSLKNKVQQQAENGALRIWLCAWRKWTIPFPAGLDLHSPSSGQTNPLHDYPPSFICPFLLLPPRP